ncbi:hypothetical protein D3C83_87580 [compost metagenome]
MDELQRALHLGVLRQPALQPVLDRLDVVVGLGLDVLDVRGVLVAETRHQAIERGRGAA